MFVVMGATGHVGGAVADALLARGETVTIVTRKPERAADWRAKGADVAVADAGDAEALRAAFGRGRRAFLLNPPADPSGDTDASERRTIDAILAALSASGLEKVVAASTYGAQPGDSIGDLSTLWEFEQGLHAQPIPAAINRGAYYMTNWLGVADAVRQSGRLPSMFPADVAMPMVAPADLGRAAADRLLAPIDDRAIHHVEGPARYTPQDVADVFAAIFGRKVVVDVAPRDRWQGIYKQLGFSDVAARSYAKMTAVSVDGSFDDPAAPDRGRITLEAFLVTALSG